MARRRKRSKKWLFRLFFLVLLVVAGAICYFVWDGYFREKPEEPQASGTAVVEEDKQEEQGGSEEKEETPTIEKEEIPQYDGEDPNTAEELSGALTYLGVSGSNLLIRVSIDQYLSSGTCRLEISRGGQVVFSDSAAIVSAASTATCEGFNVPVSEVGSGEIEVKIYLDGGGKTGKIVGGVTI